MVYVVSIPSRGSGKGDKVELSFIGLFILRFQSPLGEVVKETHRSWKYQDRSIAKQFQSPLGEVVKETNILDLSKKWRQGCFNPLSGKW